MHSIKATDIFEFLLEKGMRVDHLSNRDHWLLRFFAPLLSTLLVMSGMGFYLTFVSLYFSQQGYSELFVGIVQAAYFLGLFLGAWFLEGLMRRVGHIQVLAFSGSLLTATILIQSLIESLSIWIVTRFLAGMAMAAFYVVIECWMLDHAESQRRGFYLSLYMFALNAGYAIGQQIVPFISFTSIEAFAVGALLCTMSVIPIALSTRRLTMPDSEEGVQIYGVIKRFPFGATVCFFSGVLLSALYSFLALTGEHYGGSGPQLVTALVVGGLVAQWPLGRLSDLLDRRALLIVLCIAIFFFSILLFARKETFFPLLLGWIFLLGAGIFTLYPISLTLVADQLSPKQFASRAASLLLLYGMGSVLGPIFASFFMQQVGAQGLFLFCGVAASIALVVGIRSAIQKKPVPKEERQFFVSLPRTTTVVYELDPRIDQE